MLEVMRERRLLVTLVAVIAGVLLVVIAVWPHQQAHTAHATLIMGQDPDVLAVAPSHRHVFVLNYGDGTVGMVDIGRPTIVQTLNVGGTPHPVGYGLAIAQEVGHVFVVNGGNAVRMLDVASGAVLRTIHLSVAPFFLAVDERTDRVFISETNNFTGHSVVMLNARTGALVRRIAVGKGASALAVDQRVGHVFVQNLGDNTVSMLDARSGILLRTITIGTGPSVLARTTGPLPTVVAVDDRTSRAFVATLGAIAVLNTRTGALLCTTPVGAVPSDVVVDTRAKRAFVANLREGTASVLDAGTGQLLQTVRVGQQPWALAASPMVGRVYVANMGDGTVSVLDARSGRVVRTAEVGPSPVAVAVDEQTAQVFVANAQAYRPQILARDQGLWRWLRWLPFLPASTSSRPQPIPGSVTILPV